MTEVQIDSGVLAGDERMLIDGELQTTGSGATFDVVHPGSEEVVGPATDGTVADLERAVAAARRAFDSTDWSRDLEFRYHCLQQLHDALQRNTERLRRIVVTEVGCPITVTGSQIEDPGPNMAARSSICGTTACTRRRWARHDAKSTTRRPEWSAPSPRGTYRSTSTSPRRCPR